MAEFRGHQNDSKHCTDAYPRKRVQSGSFRRMHSHSHPYKRAVRCSVSKRDPFFERLERRLPKKRCRRCRQKFTPPAGYTSLICPLCRRIEKAG